MGKIDLDQYLNVDKTKLTQTYRDLVSSISETFEGYGGRFNDAESFELQHNGLTKINLRLRLERGVIEVSMQGNIGLTYEQAESVQTFEYLKNGKRECVAIDGPKFRELVRSKFTCKSKWNIQVLEYQTIGFETEIKSVESDFLSDLVGLIELMGYVQRRQGRSKMF